MYFQGKTLPLESNPGKNLAMFKQKLSSPALLLAACCIFGFGATSCELSRTISSPVELDSSRTPPRFGTILEPGKSTNLGTYSKQGSRLIFRGLERDSVIHWSFCQSSSRGIADSLVRVTDTLDALDTVDWSLQGDTLIMGNWEDTLYTSRDSLPFLREQVQLRISGSNQDLNGSYRFLFGRNRLLSTVLPGSEDSADLVNMDILYKKWSQQLEETIVIMNDGSFTTIHRALTSWADFEIMKWNGGYYPSGKPDSARYDITLRKIDDRTVTETSRKTGETVTRQLLSPMASLLDVGDIRFSSTETSRPSAIEHANPSSCPDGADWYWKFREENRKSTLNARQSSNSSKADSPMEWSRLPRTLFGGMRIPTLR